MSKQLRINGRLEDHEENKTIKQLKAELGIPADSTMTFNDGDATYNIADHDTVGDISEKATVAPLPDSTNGRLFG